jgi:hypothetical protein
MKSIYINEHTFHEGDHVTAVLYTEDCDDDYVEDFVSQYRYDPDAKEVSDESTVTVHGILHIEDDNTCYICQNAKSGDNSYAKVHGKEYSWYVKIDNDGAIVSSDTCRISPRYSTKSKDELESPPEMIHVTLDDDNDPMPEDWQLPYPIPEHL